MGRKHCTLAVVRRSQKFRPDADPLPGGAGQPKFNQLELITTFTYKPSLVSINARNAISSYRGNIPTNTPTQTDRTDYSTLHRSFTSK